MATEETQARPRRKKIFWACNHCNKAHITCDEGRPCVRCIKKGLQDTCADAPRKRKKYLADVPPLVVQSSPESLPPQDQGQAQSSNRPSPESLATDMTPNIKTEPELRPGPRPSIYGATQFQHSASHPSPLAPKYSQMISSVSVNDVARRSSPSLFARDGQTTGYFPHGVTSNPGLGLGVKAETTAETTPKQLPGYSPRSFTGPQPKTNSTLFNGSQTAQEQNLPKRGSKETAPAEKKRVNFLSSAADMEYATLSNILQDNFLGLHPNHSFTSNEGTPTSVNMSPALSPHGYENASKPSPLASNAMGPADLNQQGSGLEIDGHGIPNQGFHVNQYNSLSEFPPFDAHINQYFLGDTTHYDNVKYPDVCEAMDMFKLNDLGGYFARNSKLSISFTMSFPKSSVTSRNLLFTDPEEIYVKIKKPFSYTPGFHRLIAYLRSRFPREMLVKMAESMAVYRPSFIACTNSLRESDLIFMEQCFQRTLLTYDNFIKVSGTPTIVWRRTGEIAYVGDEFTTLTGWTQQHLLGDKPTFIVELLDDKSVVEYFQLFSKIAFGDFLGATMTECTLLTPKQNVKIRAGCSWTMKRDVFGIPMMIIGNFLPIL